MNKIFTLAIALALFASGYYLGLNKSPTQKEFVLKFVEIEHVRNDIEIMTNIEVMSLLEKGESGRALSLLRANTSNLVVKPTWYMQESSEIAISEKFYKPGEAAFKSAIAYQKEFCKESCLGL